jgi:hypothetical protein
MIPITQTKVVVKNSKGEIVVRGNCYAACIASLMEIPITEVPNVEVFYHLDNGYHSEVMLTFLNSKGWDLCSDDRFKYFHQAFEDMNFGGRDNYAGCFDELKDKLYLASGKSERGVSHICIFKNGKLIHDPHPTKECLKTIEYFQTLEKINE